MLTNWGVLYVVVGHGDCGSDGVNSTVLLAMLIEVCKEI